jgi:hypothetical protein
MSIIHKIKGKLQIEPKASDSPGICLLSPGLLGGQSPANFRDYARLAIKDNLILLIEDGRLGTKPSRLTLSTPRDSQERAAAYSRAATGFWSHVASQIFPQSRFYLIEPLLEQYQRRDKAIYSMHPEFVTIAAAAGDRPGEAVLNVSPDLYSSSFFHESIFG